jgi:hypothetical protein
MVRLKFWRMRFNENQTVQYKMCKYKNAQLSVSPYYAIKISRLNDQNLMKCYTTQNELNIGPMFYIFSLQSKTWYIIIILTIWCWN